jgi:hypothetical protein
MGNRTRSNRGGSQGRIRPKRAQAGRPNPFWAWFGAPFDLAAIRTTYSPLTNTHGRIDSSSAVEELRREGLHSGEEKVEMVD